MPATQKTEMIALKHLLLDGANPRFGGMGEKGWEQADVLDHIVRTFGVDDVLSSLAINGYIQAEPLVCHRASTPSKVVVVEGNRRLAACLILAGDPRAARQKARASQYQDIWRKHGSKSIDPLPTIVFSTSERKRALLSYLGVRHIASAQPWDSYAKAAWVAEVVSEHKLPLVDVALMIGDHHGTVKRLLEGYYFIKQTIEAGEFRPQDSQRRGRGSVTEYPFSWVYTILGYTATRNYLGLEDNDPKLAFLAKSKLARAGTVTRAMFGDKTKGRSASIEDSRQLGDLASVFADPIKISMLEAGKSVLEIGRLTMPVEQRIRDGLTQVQTLQAEIISSLAGEIIDTDVAKSIVPISQVNRRTAEAINQKIEESAKMGSK